MSLHRPARYAVVGNPVEHSQSPFIHQQFAAQSGIEVQYEKLCVPVQNFPSSVQTFFQDGGCGLNVTVPFKEQAFALTGIELSARASSATAVNTLWMARGRLQGCNTDGVGLIHDLKRLRQEPAGKRVLLLGAGGAAKGVMLPLLQAGCHHLHIANRSPERAQQLAIHAMAQPDQDSSAITAGSLSGISGRWDLVINATSASLSKRPPELPTDIYADGALAYDMVYGSHPTPFMQQALVDGAATTSDGLGMLVGQAAASFHIWHGVQVDIEPVLQALRLRLQDS